MRILCVGGGPAGLYAALLLKKADSTRSVTVVDRNPPDATYGWGVVFSDETLTFLRDADRPTYRAMRQAFVRWTAIDTFYRGEHLRSGGHAFSGLSRRGLLQILQDRCEALGVELRFNQSVDPSSLPQQADLVLACDGLNSGIRQAHQAAFQPNMDVHRSRYIWLGLTRRLPAFTFDFEQTEFGIFQAHAYPFASDLSTFIVECNEDVWRRAGLDRASEADSVRFCEELFRARLEGASLLSNRASWISFITLRNASWRGGNIALLGDAAHTAHFSVGSGTKMAMEDAIALARCLDRCADLRAALLEYEELRQPVVERTQAAARESSLWFEHVPRYAGFSAPQFAFSLLTRSKRITYGNLRRRDPEFSDRVDAAFALAARPEGDHTVSYPPPQPSTCSLRVGQTVFSNRLVHAPADPDCATDGLPGDRHLLELGAGWGHGLVLVGPVAVSPEARITPGSAGLYTAGHERAWHRIVRLLEEGLSARAGIELVHAGPRGSTASRSQGTDIPLRIDGWELLAASAAPYTERAAVPQQMTPADMLCVEDQYVDAARRAVRCGFSVLELQFGHGYLQGSFLSPLTNRRTDDYGGCLDNRLRFPQRILSSVRAVWPQDRVLSVKFSASDWDRGGTTEDDAVAMARAFRSAGADLLHVVSGQTTSGSNPPYGRAWEAHLGDLVRNETAVPVLLGGNITTLDETNTLVAAGRADLCIVSHRGMVGKGS